METSLGAQEVEVVCDPDKIRQVILNIVQNALEAMEGQAQKMLSVSTGSDDRCGKVCISDNGPGIGKEHLEHIFKPFYTTKPNGTGLGLPLCRQLMKEQGGCIDVTQAQRLRCFYPAPRRHRRMGSVIAMR